MRSTEASERIGSWSQLGSVLSGAAISQASTSAWIIVRGPDRVRWLNGMVTNSIQHLTHGAGCYNFVLNPQGRIQGDAYAFAEPDQILLRTDQSQLESLTALLDRYIIMDDVELSPGPEGWHSLQVVGPEAAVLLHEIGIDTDAPTLGLVRRLWRAHELSLVRLRGPLVPRFELWSDAATIDEAAQALNVVGAVRVDGDTLEQLRVLEGTPRFGTDITDRELPQETGQTQALHFAKGCYIGQEIVERIRSRGAVNRVLTGLRLEGSVPTTDHVLYHEGKNVGELRSCLTVPLPDVGGKLLLALSYVRREALDRAVPLIYDGGTAFPITLPYIAARSEASKLLREEHHA